MGQIKEYYGLRMIKYALQNCYMIKSGNAYDVPTYYDINGEAITKLYCQNYDSNNCSWAMKWYQPYKVEKVATFSGDYSDTDYTFVDEANTTLVTSTFSNNDFKYTISVRINAITDINVTALKFSKLMATTNSSDAYRKDILMWGYFFDEPLKLKSGETKTITLTL